MAKKPKKDEEATVVDTLALLRTTIEKKWGNVMVPASTIMDEKLTVIPVSPVLDGLLSGGIQEGTWNSITGPPKTGKEQPVWSVVHTPSGPVPIGNIVVGDIVCSPNGGIAKVSGVFPQGVKPVYKVTFNGGDVAYCGLDHLWEVRTRFSKKARTLPLSVIMMDLHHGDGRPRWRIKLPSALYYSPQPCSIDPYLLGMLIGNGGFSTRCTSKFIPKSYLYNCVQVRQALLNGLMDTDGTVDDNGRCSYATSSPQLASDFKTLAVSLGHICKVKKKMAKYKDGRRLAFVCYIRSNNETSLFKLKRKQSRTHNRVRGVLERGIAKVERDVDAECVCISLDSVDGLYLTDNCIVTHNTTTILSAAAKAQLPEYGSRHIHYFDVERRVKLKNLGGIRGLNLDPERFIIYRSEPDRILSAQDHLEMCIHVLQTDPHCMVIIDSVSALVESAVLTEGLGTQTRGGGAKLMSQFIDIVASVVPVQRSIVMGVTHQIADTGGGGGKVEKTSNRWLYQADNRLKIMWSEGWVVGGSKDKDGKQVGGREIGKKIHWLCQESALGPPGMKAVGYLRYGVGVDSVYEVFEMGKAANILTISGAWYSFDFLLEKPELLDGKEVPKVQGGEKAYGLLAANPSWSNFLRQKVDEFMSAGDEDGAA